MKFTKSTQVDPLERTRQALKCEREFWDDIVTYMVDETTRPEDVERIAEVAERLLSLRRDKFPVEER